MKRNYLMTALCLLWAINANALIVSVGQEELDEEGLEMTLIEAEEDPLSGKMLMKVDGSLLSNGPLTVTISRSAAGLTDEFCCAGQCIPGNSQTSETLHLTPSGTTKWYVHYTPAPNSHETVVYTFSDSEESLVLTVHYNNDAEGIEEVQKNDVKCTKFLRDGIVYIEYNNRIYPL